MAERLLLRRDTAANWTAANPVLALGEPGFDETAGRWKMGDGATAWSSLAFATDQVGAAAAAQAAAQSYADGRFVPATGLDTAMAGVVTPGGSATAAAIAADPAVRAAYVPKWKPSTAYASGEPVLNPSGQIVTANSAFTSGASYNAANWTVVSGGGGTPVTVTDHGTYATLTVG